MKYLSIDLFSGCGGLSEGMRTAGFHVLSAIDSDNAASECYTLNHPDTVLIKQDIRKVSSSRIKELLKGSNIHLLAGCPPCQGFSSVRRLNKKNAVDDDRNLLIKDYLRFVKKLKPLTFMMENVPGLMDYSLFKEMIDALKRLQYHVDFKVVDVAQYGVPQRRRRLVLLGSRLGSIKIADPQKKKRTVRDAIGNLESISKTTDPLHKIVVTHSKRVMELIRKIPRNGGSRKDLPNEFQLACHKKPNVGFNDIYGRLRWDDYSSTITGGCLNPSKGRFLHPVEDRVITPREAALLQTFPKNYKFPINMPKAKLALMIGNALPPEFSRIQAAHILNHIKQYNSDILSKNKE